MKAASLKDKKRLERLKRKANKEEKEDETKSEREIVEPEAKKFTAFRIEGDIQSSLNFPPDLMREDEVFPAVNIDDIVK